MNAAWIGPSSWVMKSLALPVDEDDDNGDSNGDDDWVSLRLLWMCREKKKETIISSSSMMF